jgi:hypothetical protein
MSTQSIEELIARSSLGTHTVRRLRDRTSAAAAEDIIKRTDRTNMHGKQFLIRVLRELDRRQGPEVMTVIDISYGDAFDFGSLGPRTNCGVPGIHHGQLADWRIRTEGIDGLHGLVRADGVAFHLDRQDACRSPIAHGISDTEMIEGAVIGGLALAAIVALAGGTAGNVAIAAAVGAGLGGAIGAHVPARRASVIRFRDLFAQVAPQPFVCP